jgi:hypothetical protein
MAVCLSKHAIGKVCCCPSFLAAAVASEGVGVAVAMTNDWRSNTARPAHFGT